MTWRDLPRHGWLAALFVFVSVLSPLHAEILTFYADKGFLPGFTGVPVFSGICGSGAAVGQSPDLVPPEGYSSWKMSDTNPCDTWSGWSVIYPSMNLSRFNSGELRFWINSNTTNVKLEIQNPSGVNVRPAWNLGTDLGYTSSWLNKWKEIRVPLVGVPLTNVSRPFVLTALGSPPGTFYTDNIHYVDSIVSPIYNISIHNISDNSSAAQITWNSLTLPAGWTRADQYIRVELDPDAVSWGLQIYTDNKASDADPQFAGAPGTNPAGLVDTSATIVALPMAWAIMAGTTTAPAAVDPNNDPGFQWIFMQDRLAPTFAGEGHPALVVKNNLGIHYNQCIELVGACFGAENPPNAIFLEANFMSAQIGRTYKTSTLRLEYFTP